MEEITGHIPDAKPKPAEKSKSSQESEIKDDKAEHEEPEGEWSEATVMVTSAHVDRS